MSHIKLSVKLSYDVNRRLEQMSDRLANGNKSEMLRKMIALMDAYERENAKHGSELALVKDGEIEARILV